MLRTLRKAAQTLSRDVHTAFSTPPPTHAVHLNKLLTFPAHTVRLGPVFAEGAFSFVHVATPLSPCSTTRFAVKRLAYPSDEPETRKQIDAEINFLSSLPPHPNIVSFYGAIKQDGNAFLLFELVDGGTLPEVLQRMNNKSQHKLLSIFSDIVAAVAHLHAQIPPVAMRDVKLENVLYDRLNRCYKLCDFGSVSTFAGRYTRRKDIVAAEEEVANCCTSMYRAPELVDLYAKPFVCEKVDVWALGCVWYAMLYARLPFDGLSSLQIMKGLGDLPEDPKYSEQVLDILRGMLTVSPAERWDVFRVLEKVAALQGKQMDSSMRIAAERLRKRRRSDLWVNDDSRGSKVEVRGMQHEGAPDVEFVAIGQNNEWAKEGGTVGSGSLIDLGEADSSGYQSTGNTGVQHGWADFEHAFGVESTKGGVETVPTVERKELDGKETKLSVKGKNEMRDRTLLINLDGLHLNNTEMAPAKAKREEDNIKDLIDFG